MPQVPEYISANNIVIIIIIILLFLFFQVIFFMPYLIVCSHIWSE